MHFQLYDHFVLPFSCMCWCSQFVSFTVLVGLGSRKIDITWLWPRGLNPDVSAWPTTLHDIHMGKFVDHWPGGLFSVSTFGRAWSKSAFWSHIFASVHISFIAKTHAIVINPSRLTDYFAFEKFQYLCNWRLLFVFIFKDVDLRWCHWHGCMCTLWMTRQDALQKDFCQKFSK